MELLDFLPTKEAVGSVSRFGKSFCKLSRRKFELKQKDIHLLDEEVVVGSKFS